MYVIQKSSSRIGKAVKVDSNDDGEYKTISVQFGEKIEEISGEALKDLTPKLEVMVRFDFLKSSGSFIQELRFGHIIDKQLI